MTNTQTIRQKIAAAVSAAAVSAACVLGTVGPVQADTTTQPATQYAAQADMIVVTGQTA